MDEDLTEVEKVAKKFVLDLHVEAIDKKCSLDANDMVPEWYDSEKFRRAQQYFHNNRFGMMYTNLIGLLTLLSEPHGLQILDSTGKSSETETAKQRYIRTTLHMLSWFKTDFQEKSISWESLRKVRRYHFHASNGSEKKGLGHISILELSSTTFGFMGYALTRPKMFGIKHSDAQELESYLHFWAVVGHALGVEDKYNMCLFPVEVVIQICEIMRRYVFIPLLQVEQPLFKSMVTALVKGYADYVPMLSYPSLVFETRRITGIPGYQLKHICMDESICKQIYTKDELHIIRSALKKYSGYYTEDICFTEQIPLIEVKRSTNSVGEMYKKLEGEVSLEMSLEHKLEKYLDLQPNEKVSVTFFNTAEWLDQMNDTKLKLMSKNDKYATLLRCKALQNNERPFFRYMNEIALNISLFLMKRQQK